MKCRSYVHLNIPEPNHGKKSHVETFPHHKDSTHFTPKSSNIFFIKVHNILITVTLKNIIYPIKFHNFYHLRKRYFFFMNLIVLTICYFAQKYDCRIGSLHGSLKNNDLAASSKMRLRVYEKS